MPPEEGSGDTETSATAEALAERVARVERQNRRVTLVAAVIGAIVLLVVAISLARSSITVHTVRAEQP